MTPLERAREDWYPVEIAGALAAGQTKATRLLGQDIVLTGTADGSVTVTSVGADWPVCVAFDHVWTSPSQTPRPLFEIPEAQEKERRFVPCGVVRVKCSPLRAVENFLDIAHFPFVHTDILGSEPYTEVEPYKVDITDDGAEVIAAQYDLRLWARGRPPTR